MFITDTVDAIYPPDGWRPEALLDKASEVVNSLPTRGMLVSATHCRKECHPSSDQTQNEGKTPISFTSSKENARRRPLLRGTDVVSSIYDLGPFLSHASLTSYESLYATCGQIDWEAVEESVLNDI